MATRSNITRNSTMLVSRSILLLDIVAVWLSAFMAGYIRYDQLAIPHYADTLVLATSLMLAFFSYAIYQSFKGGSWMAMLTRVQMAWVATVAAVIAWLFISKSSSDYSRIFMGTWFSLMLGILVASRTGAYLLLKWLSKKGYNTKNVLLIGSGPMSADLRSRSKRGSWSGYQITRSVEPHAMDKIATLGEQGGFDEVWINLSVHQADLVPRILDALRHCTADIRVVPDMITYKLINHGVTFILGMPMLDISASALNGENRLIKLVEDYVLATLILILITPVLLILAIAVKLTSPGPILFRQKRHGWNGEKIVVYKFRTMKVHEEKEGVVTQATKDDNRLTSIGGFLRRHSLDELPQFINVLQGRMSIVGPRPHAVQHNDHYKEIIPRYMLRHKMKPGITGWAQVNGLRGQTETVAKMKERVDFDLYYLEHWSVLLDLRIIFMTIFKGFSSPNAF